MNRQDFVDELTDALDRRFARALAPTAAPTIVQVDASVCEDGVTILLWGYDAAGRVYTADASDVAWHRQG